MNELDQPYVCPDCGETAYLHFPECPQATTRPTAATDPRDRHRHIYGNRYTRGWGIGWGRLHGPLARTGFSADRHLVIVEVRGRYLEFVR